MTSDVGTTELERRIAEQTRQRAGSRKASAAVTPERPAQQGRKPDRWACLNSFVDVIAPRLTLAERAVWMLMFRHARNGQCETTARLLAGAANISLSTAQLALSRLDRAGLVWPIWKSKDRAKASKYGIHPNPADCLPRVIQQGEPCR